MSQERYGIRRFALLNTAGKKNHFFCCRGFTVKKALRIVRAIDDVHTLTRCPGGEIGRHASFRCWSSQGGGGSSPLLGTID